MGTARSHLRKIKTPCVRRRLTQAAFITLSCSCYEWKWCHVARVVIPQGENSNFAKQSQFPYLNEFEFRKTKTSMSARSSSPRMKMCANRPQLLGQRTHKVILPNKPNSPSSSRNQNISIRYDDLFSEEANFHF